MASVGQRLETASQSVLGLIDVAFAVNPEGQFFLGAMPTELIWIGAVIAGFSFIQSIFGMGLLIFGTPLLLLLGFGFLETISCLLPASLAISVLQLQRHKEPKPKIPRDYFTICLPAIVFSLSIFIQSDLISDAKLAVGLMLLVAASMRLIPALNKWMIAAVQRQIRLYHLVMGILHGATNLGGAMLAILAGATQDEKAQIRFTVSFYYLGFAIIQCSTLIISGNGVGLLNGVLFAPIAVVVFFIAGNPIFSQLKNSRYQKVLTYFIFSFGLALFVNFSIQ